MVALAHGTDEWFEARTRLVGASEVAAILGLSPFESAAEVWGRKKGLLPPVQVTEQMRRGQALEAGVARMFTEETGIEVLPDQMGVEHGPLIITRDYVTADTPHCPVEIKTSPDGYHDYWEWQLQTQMLLTDAPYGILAWLGHDQLVHHKRIERDKARQAEIKWAASDFVERLLPLDAWPDEAPANVLAKVVPAEPDSTVELDDITAALVQRLAEVRAASKKAKEVEEELAAQIGRVLGSAEVGLYRGKRWVTWKQSKPSVTFDSAGYRAAHPRGAKKWLGQKAGSRPMLTVLGKESVKRGKG